MGAGGRERGLPEPSDSEILTKGPARPAPPEGGAADFRGVAPCAGPSPVVVTCWLAGSFAVLCRWPACSLECLALLAALLWEPDCKDQA